MYVRQYSGKYDKSRQTQVGLRLFMGVYIFAFTTFLCYFLSSNILGKNRCVVQIILSFPQYDPLTCHPPYLLPKNYTSMFLFLLVTLHLQTTSPFTNLTFLQLSKFVGAKNIYSGYHRLF